MKEYEIIIVLLFLKHFVFDFVLQNQKQLLNKGKYGNWYGITHSLFHALATFVILAFFHVKCAIVLSIFELLVHYHADWIKARFGSKNVHSDRYWVETGLDHLVHSLTYLIITGYIVRTINS
jgi:hypothetical protein